MSGRFLVVDLTLQNVISAWLPVVLLFVNARDSGCSFKKVDLLQYFERERGGDDMQIRNYLRESARCIPFSNARDHGG
jgi:hypothetical protein